MYHALVHAVLWSDIDAKHELLCRWIKNIRLAHSLVKAGRVAIKDVLPGFCGLS